GGICLIAGLFTRFFAAALAIEMLIALLVVHLPRGYSAGGGGYEYVLLIGAACFFIAIRGGGPYSVGRTIRTELLSRCRGGGGSLPPPRSLPKHAMLVNRAEPPTELHLI